MSLTEWLMWLGGMGLVLWLVIIGGRDSGLNWAVTLFVAFLLVIAFVLGMFSYREMVRDIRARR